MHKLKLLLLGKLLFLFEIKINHRNIHSNIFLTKKSKFSSHRINPKLLNDGVYNLCA